jgi:hypothetical protein
MSPLLLSLIIIGSLVVVGAVVTVVVIVMLPKKGSSTSSTPIKSGSIKFSTSSPSGLDFPNDGQLYTIRSSFNQYLNISSSVVTNTTPKSWIFTYESDGDLTTEKKYTIRTTDGQYLRPLNADYVDYIENSEVDYYWVVIPNADGVRFWIRDDLYNNYLTYNSAGEVTLTGTGAADQTKPTTNVLWTIA